MTIEEFLLDGQSTIVLARGDMVGGQLLICVIIERVQTVFWSISGIVTIIPQVSDVIPTIDRRLVGAACDIAIEHAVHHHSVDIAGGGGGVVITYNTAHIRAARNRSKRVAVNHPCRAFE